MGNIFTPPESMPLPFLPTLYVQERIHYSQNKLISFPRKLNGLFKTLKPFLLLWAILRNSNTTILQLCGGGPIEGTLKNLYPEKSC